MSQREKKHTAIHEAGHAVASVRLEIDCGVTSIIPEEDILGHHQTREFDGFLHDPQDEVICLCAGYAALIAAGYDKEEASLGCGADFGNAKAISENYGLGPFEQQLMQATELMGTPENRKAVKVVADALMERSNIDFDLCSVLVDLSDGEITEAEYERYLVSRESMNSSD